MAKGGHELKLEDYQARDFRITDRIPDLSLLESGTFILVPEQEGWKEAVDTAREAWEETAEFFVSRETNNILDYDYKAEPSEPEIFTAKSLFCRAKAVGIIRASNPYIDPKSLEACMERLLKQGFELAQEGHHRNVAQSG